jgi:serine/threonine protein kinase
MTLVLTPPLAAGEELAPGLEVIEHLARNLALDVYDAWDRDRYCRVVVKAVRPDRAGVERVVARLRREGELLARLAHPHIVRAYETREEPTPLVVLETLSGETLDHLVHRRTRGLPAGELAILGLQLCSAVRYLHRSGQLHLDLKPENVIVDQGFVKLLDLSLTRPPGLGPRGLGTPLYCAPEQARGGEFTTAADVWGVGAVLFEAATQQPPFGDGDEHEETHPQLTQRAPRVRTLRPRLPRALAATIDGCLEPETRHRPTLDEVIAALEPLA